MLRFQKKKLVTLAHLKPYSSSWGNTIFFLILLRIEYLI